MRLWLGRLTVRQVRLILFSCSHQLIAKISQFTRSWSQQHSGIHLSSSTTMYLTRNFLTGDCQSQTHFCRLPFTDRGYASKPPTQTFKLSTIQKLILSFFLNVLHLIDQLSASDTLVLAVNESAKLLPYVVSSRKAVKLYLKVCRVTYASVCSSSH